MTILVPRFTFIVLIFLSIPLTSTAQTVTIPDSNLRAAIEEALGKASGDPVTTSDMAALTHLEANHSNINDLTGLEHAINLTEFFLWGNSISDISSLSELTNLISLSLWDNSISDISSLVGLTNLTRLSLYGNSISDLSALVTNTGLGSGDTVNVKGNPLSSVSIDTQIPALQSRGVTVEFDNIVAGVVVEFPDTNLRAAIERTLGKASGAPITTSDMVLLTRLNSINSNISDMTGLEHAINLTELSLWDNSISDITSLSGLTNLTRLDLGGNSISDLSSLSGLINLTMLWLWGNSISDITSLSGLTSLTRLSLGGNSISDLSSLSGLIKLTELHLWDNSVSDLSSLVGLTNLTELYLYGNSISDLSSLSGLINLTELSLYGNSISDVSALVANTGLGSGDTVNVKANPLSSISIDTQIPALQSRGVRVEFDDIVAGLPVNLPDSNLRAVIEGQLGKTSGDTITTSDMATLTQLDARRSNISDLTGLEHAINLTALWFQDNPISDLSSLARLTKLVALYLGRNSISDLSSLSGLTNLKSLSLDNNSISDLSSLSGLTNLKSLSLSGNSILDISSLLGLTNLTRLDLGNNSISDLSAVARLTNLETLDLSGNSISDLSSLSGLTNLTELSLYGNSISDLSALVANTGLGSGDTVNVRVNPLISVSIDTHIPALQSRGVRVEFDDIVAGVVVNIPDSNLRAAIEGELGKTSGDTITTSDMAALTRLYAIDSNISDLTGLEYAINLTWLSLWDNSISDISLLSGLTNLTWLYLNGNSISDITSLSGLDNLTELFLWSNSISDLSALVANTGLGSGDTVNVKFNPLSSVSIDTHIPALQSRGVTVEFDAIVAGVVDLPDSNLRAAIETALDKASGDTIMTSDMAALTWLSAINSNIIDLTGLEHAINLISLNLGGNSISDLSSLGGLTSLTRLDLRNNSISDLSAVVVLTNLIWLALNGNSISDISSLSGLTNLTWLDLGNNSISDISALAGLTNLESLDLYGNSISDISLVAGLTNLTKLSLWDNLISDISLLSGLTSLTSLYLYGNLISDISSLSGLINLTELYLWGNSISDITSLSGLTNLTELSISENSISDISSLVGLTNLTSLDLGSNLISDITSLSGLTNLAALWLWDNSISDLSALVTNTGLESGDTVNVKENPLSSVSIKTHIPALLSREVRVEFDEPPVNIPDTNLRAAIEMALGKASGAAITTSDVATLTWLSARESNIIDLTGLEHAINLTWLHLYDNSISDISVVVGLTNLTQLYLGNNSISDLPSFSGLTNLTELSISENSISDISSLSGLTNLTELSISENSISDISPLSGLTNLTELSISENSISDISPLSGLTNLTRLSISHNSISDITSLAGLTNMTELSIWGNSISDITSLGGLTNLTSLNLSSNLISDLSALVINTGLESEDTVNVRDNPLSYASINMHVPTLQSRGVTVRFDDRAHRAILKISGDNQEGMPSEVLANPFVVEVQDATGSTLAGVSVTFAVTGGGGTLSIHTTTTDANGRAESTLTLGPNFGTNTVFVSAAGIEGLVTFHAIGDNPEFLWSIPSGYSLIHVPLKVTAVDGVPMTIRSIADLYDALGGADTVTYLITLDSQTQEWFVYFRPSDRGTPNDRKLTDDMGIITQLITPVSVRLTGSPLGTNGTSTITLNPGYNLVGLPLRDSRVRRVSHLFALEGIGGNIPAIIFTDNGEFKAVIPAGGPGDIPIIGGQAFMLDAQQAATVAVSGDGWYNTSETAAAPLLSLKGIEVGDTTPVLGLRGSIVDEGMGTNSAGFRVIVKNLSTGRAVATVTKDENYSRPDKQKSERVGYQVVIVDVETGRAAQIGDILEISVRSPSPLIGVQPLRYTVTAEDVKRGLIQLTELVAYEIPAETELLHNYPNPFNPETWIPYRLAEDAFVTLTIYDGSGHVIRTLDVGHQIASAYENRSKAVYWDGRNGLGEQVASGVYFYHLSAGDFSATRKMVILK